MKNITAVTGITETKQSTLKALGAMKKSSWFRLIAFSLKYRICIATLDTMTAITLNLSPELEQKLPIEADKAGIDPDRYIVNTLQERLQSTSTEKATGADLLQQINIGFSAETWAQYHTLITKRHAETLSKEDHETLIRLSDGLRPTVGHRLEKLNVARIQALIQLANLRNQPLSDLMETLSIRPNPEVLDYA
jgi:hypothetical protein